MLKRSSAEEIGELVILWNLGVSGKYVIKEALSDSTKADCQAALLSTVDSFQLIFFPTDDLFKKFRSKYCKSGDEFLKFLVPRLMMLSEEASSFNLLLTCAFASRLVAYNYYSHKCFRYAKLTSKILKKFLTRKYGSVFEEDNEWDSFISFCIEKSKLVNGFLSDKGGLERVDKDTIKQLAGLVTLDNKHYSEVQFLIEKFQGDIDLNILPKDEYDLFMNGCHEDSKAENVRNISDDLSANKTAEKEKACQVQQGENSDEILGKGSVVINSSLLLESLVSSIHSISISTSMSEDLKSNKCGTLKEESLRSLYSLKAMDIANENKALEFEREWIKRYDEVYPQSIFMPCQTSKE